MLNNYKKDHNGIIFQIEKDKFNYDDEYVESSYSIYKETPLMSHLRLGFLIGSIAPYKPKKILDVGYGNGDFIDTASKYIDECYGFDVPPAYPLKNHITQVDSIYGQSYDVACFFDSLEHFIDVYEIKKLDTKYILISLPWCHNFDDEWFKGWKHRKPDEHLWHFDLESIKSFMEEVGYDYICHSSIEDTIRTPDNNYPNILSCVFKKI